jgi:hypothetical protein
VDAHLPRHSPPAVNTTRVFFHKTMRGASKRKQENKKTKTRGTGWGTLVPAVSLTSDFMSCGSAALVAPYTAKLGVDCLPLCVWACACSM